MDAFVGEIAGLGAAAAYSVGSVFYTFAGRKVSAITCMAMSLPISWLALVVIHRLVLGAFFPANVPFDRWFFLGASGVTAFGVSSYFLINAYQNIGPRLTMLIGSFAPVLGALLAWVFLGQILPLSSTVGIVVVIFGIVWVVAERSSVGTGAFEPNLRRGVIFACLATLTQGAAYVFMSRGVAGDFPPFSAALIRITIGIAALWVFIAFQGNLRSTATVFRRDWRLLLQLGSAGLIGPVTAGSLLLLSLQLVPVGIATTLSNTTAIILIPIGYFAFKERITLRAIVGTVITIAGIAILFAL